MRKEFGKINVIIDVIGCEDSTFIENDNSVDVLYNSEKKFTICENAYAQIHDNLTLAVYNNADVTSYSNGIVKSSGNSHVEAWDNSIVEAEYDTRVFAHNQTTVKAYSNAVVKAYDNSEVKLYDNAIVKAYNNTVVESYNNSIVLAYQDSIVNAFDFSIVRKLSSNVAIKKYSDYVTLASAIREFKEDTVVYKKVRTTSDVPIIAKLKCPKGQIFQSECGSKCRTSSAEVLGFYDFNEDPIPLSTAVSLWSPMFFYKVGKTVQSYYDTDIEECSFGIHFFLSFDDAKDYK